LIGGLEYQFNERLAVINVHFMHEKCI